MPTLAELSRPARRPPSSAPSVLAISKRNARLTSALRPGRETLATAADVAMTPIKLAPTATRIGRPNRRVNAGTRKMSATQSEHRAEHPSNKPGAGERQNGHRHRRGTCVDRHALGGGRRGMLVVISARDVKSDTVTRAAAVDQALVCSPPQRSEQITPEDHRADAMQPEDRPTSAGPRSDESAPIDDSQHGQRYHDMKPMTGMFLKMMTPQATSMIRRHRTTHCLPVGQQRAAPPRTTNPATSQAGKKRAKSQIGQDAGRRRSSRRRSHCLSAASVWDFDSVKRTIELVGC